MKKTFAASQYSFVNFQMNSNEQIQNLFCKVLILIYRDKVFSTLGLETVIKMQSCWSFMLKGNSGESLIHDQSVNRQ